MIYVAAPYSHPEKEVIEMRMKCVNKYCKELVLVNKAFISPLTVGHTLVELYPELPTSSEFWLSWCETLIEGATELHVLKLEGWKHSEGVKKEIEWAMQLGIKVHFIE